MQVNEIITSLKIIIPIILIIIVLIIIFWVFYKKNKKLFTAISEEEKRLNNYKSSINELKNSALYEPEKDFKKLNKLARDFFKDYFNLSHNKTYLELEKYFKKQNKTEYANFCRQMSDINYTGEKSNKTQVKILINAFEKIIKNY